MLEGRRGLVVGVSGERSLGFACLRRLCAEGAEVAATFRDAPGREGLPALLARAGCAAAEPLDVRDSRQLEAVVAKVGERFGRLDFLVHTVVHVPAPALQGPLTAVDRALFSQVVLDAAHSLVALCAGARDLLAASEAGSVVALTSESSRLVTPRYHVAGIAKAALEATVRYLALELGESGVTCNAVSAPPLSTDGSDAAIGAAPMAKTEAHVAERAMVRPAATAEDVAQAVAFLASGRARGLTAQVITVDGGFSRLYLRATGGRGGARSGWGSSPGT